MKDPRIDRAVSLCKKVVSSFSFSWKRRRDLAKAQQELNIPEHQLISESPTRWGSRQKIIERLLEQERAVSKILGSDKKTRHLVLHWQELEVLESVHRALKPLVKFTDALSGEDYVTVSYVKPVLHLFESSILAVQEDDTPLTKSIKVTILDYLKEKFADPETNKLLDMASLMDPRFNTTYIAEEKIEDIKLRAMAEMEKMLSDQGAAEATVSQPHEEEPPKKKTLGSFFKKASRALPLPYHHREASSMSHRLRLLRLSLLGFP